MNDATLLELEALKTEREAWAGAHAYDPCQASHDKLMGISSRIRALAGPAEPTTEAETELRELLTAFLDAAVLPGHGVTDEQRERACLLCGRWCQPFIDKSTATEHAPKPQAARDSKRRECWTVWRLGARVNVSLFESRIRRQSRSYVDPPGEVVHMVELRPGEHIATGSPELPEELKALVRAAIGMNAHGEPPDPETFDHAEFTIITEFIRAVEALPDHLLRACGIEER